MTVVAEGDWGVSEPVIWECYASETVHQTFRLLLSENWFNFSCCRFNLKRSQKSIKKNLSLKMERNGKNWKELGRTIKIYNKVQYFLRNLIYCKMMGNHKYLRNSKLKSSTLLAVLLEALNGPPR